MIGRGGLNRLKMAFSEIVVMLYIIDILDYTAINESWGIGIHNVGIIILIYSIPSSSSHFLTLSFSAWYLTSIFCSNFLYRSSLLILFIKGLCFA